MNFLDLEGAQELESQSRLGQVEPSLEAEILDGIGSSLDRWIRIWNKHGIYNRFMRRPSKYWIHGMEKLTPRKNETHKMRTYRRQE